MEGQLASRFLPLLFLTWLPVGTVSRREEAGIVVECKSKVWSENFMVCVKRCILVGLEAGNQTNATALGENTANLTSPRTHAANAGIYECMVFITGINLTDTGNSTRGTHPSCGPEAPLTDFSEKKTWTELDCLLCVIFGLMVGTLLYMPIIGVLLWQCGRNRNGKLTSRQVVEGNRLSMAPPGTGAEDLTYANLKFEPKGTKAASSDVVYTEIKPPQQKPGREDAGAASAGVGVSPDGEGK